MQTSPLSHTGCLQSSQVACLKLVKEQDSIFIVTPKRFGIISLKPSSYLFSTTTSIQHMPSSTIQPLFWSQRSHWSLQWCTNYTGFPLDSFALQISLLMHHLQFGTSPSSLVMPFSVFKSTRSSLSNLSNLPRGKILLRINSNFENRAISIAGAVEWNCLTASVHQCRPTSATQFPWTLKMYRFTTLHYD